MDKIETLGKGISLIVTEDHGFGTDALLLADFASPKRKDMVIDLGTGCGIIPMLFKRNGVTAPIYGMDIQENAYKQFLRTLEINPSLENVIPVHGDLRNLPDFLPKGRFRLVTMNPPYKPVNTGIISESESDKIARHETNCTTEDFVKAAATLLNYGGRLCICQRPERLVDIMAAFRAGGIEPKRLRFVSKRPNTRPWLFLLEGKLHGKPFLQVEPPLFIQDENGNNSEELTQIIGEYGRND